MHVKDGALWACLGVGEQSKTWIFTNTTGHTLELRADRSATSTLLDSVFVVAKPMPGIDTDGDGFSDYEEYLMGTDPTAYTDDNVGAIGGTHDVGVDGSASYSIPISIPAGTAGMQPSVALVYNSNVGNGLLGVGWNISGLSAIIRCPTTLVQDGFIDGVDFDNNDKFCMDGQRLVEVDSGTDDEGAYIEYRTENESFTKILSYGTAASGPDWFKVWTASGQIVEYGKSVDAKVKRNNEGTVIDDILEWSINKVSDRFSNYLTYTYFTDNATGEHRITDIDYAGNSGASVSPHHSVQFEYQSRTDDMTSYLAGSKYTVNNRLSMVEIYTGSTLRRQYSLNYEYSTGTGQSRITSIDDCNGQGVCLPATQFSWSAENTDVFSNTVTSGVLDWGYEEGRAWVDFDGDGRADFCRRVGDENNESSYVSCTLSTGDGFGATVTSGVLDWGYDAGRSWADVNGDGRADFCRRVGDENNESSYVSCTLSAGDSFGATVTSGVLDWGYDAGRQWVDMNADGLTDYCRVRGGENNESSYVSCTLSTGNGFGTTITSDVIDWGYDASREWADVNGDGFADFCRRVGGENNESSYVSCTLSTGNDFGVTVTSGVIDWGYDEGRSWVDSDGDGLADYCRVRGNENKQSSYASCTLTSGLIADTIPDLLTHIDNGFDVQTIFTYKPLTDTSVYIENDPISSYPVLSYQGPMYVVSALEMSDGLGGFNSTRYVYEGLQIHLQGLGSLGFSRMLTANNDTGIYTITAFSQDYAKRLQGTLMTVTTTKDAVTLSHTENTWSNYVFTDGDIDRYFQQLDHTTVIKKDLNGAFLHREENNYIYGSDFRNLRQFFSQVYDENDVVLRSKLTDNVYDNNTAQWFIGQLREITVVSIVPTLPQVRRKSMWEYDPATGRKTKAQIINPDTINDTDEPIMETQYGVDDLGQTVVDAFGHNLAVTVTGPDFESRTSSSSYDASGRYLIWTENAFGHRVTNSYYPDNHLNAGLLETTTSPNGIDTAFEYDDFGRKRYVTTADGTSRSLTTTTLFSWCADVSTCPEDALYLITSITEGGTLKKVYIDQLGREMRKTSTALDNKIVVIDYTFNALGHNDSVTELYYEGDPIYTTFITYDILGRVTQSSPPDPDAQDPTITYDGLTVTSTNENGQEKIAYKNALGELIMIEDNQGNQVSYTYDSIGKMLTVEPPFLESTVIEYDGLSRKIRMDDPDKGEWYYSYNGLGELTTQTDAKGQTTCMAYDKLGRKITQIDNYQGTLSTNIGEVSEASQGCLGDSSNLHVATWVYDTETYGLGKIDYIDGENNYKENYSYDELGLPIRVEKILNGETYSVETAYDDYNRVDTVTYPGASDRLTVQNSYDAQGFLIEVRNADDDQLYYALDSMDAVGNVTREYYGNNVVTERVLDPNTHRLDSLLSYHGSTDIQDRTFEFDPVGNLTYRHDAINEVIEYDIVYDELNRLTDISTDYSGVMMGTAEVSYDASGNILSKTNVGSYTYGGLCNGIRAGPHAVTAINGTKDADYCYDLNGNMISGDGRTIEYSYFDKPTYIEKDGNIVEIIYGPDRSRYHRKDTTAEGFTETTYVNGLYEKVQKPDGTIEERHTIGGFAIITYTDRGTGSGSTDTRYLHKDHLGTLTAITDSIGNVVERFSFDAWGKRRATNLQDALDQIDIGLLKSAITTRGFTGHEQLDPVGLIHMNGRVYDAEIGRFISADPFVQDNTNLQALNRYSYVQNNPLSYTDPSGFFLKKLFKKIAGAFKKFVQTIAHGVRDFFRGVRRLFNKIPVLQTIVSTVLTVVGCYVCALTLNAAMTIANGGTIGQVLTGVAVGMVTQGIGSKIGSGIGTVFNVAAKSAAATASAVAGQAIASGIVAKAQGMKFIDGVKGALAGAAAASAVNWVLTNTTTLPSAQQSSQTQTAQGSSSRSALNVVLDVVGKIWNLPNTVIGLVYGGVGHVVGEVGQFFDLWSAEPTIGFGNNAIEFTGNPFGGGGALTLGNTITWGVEKGGSFYNLVSDHERFHTIQGQILGPLYLPLNIFAMSASLITSPFSSTRRTEYGTSIAHGKLNFMEGPVFKDELY
ncbi:MAG: SpvB/TcaC N-terminal domain-containing protein [Proteobacteria bacterium]|nr:SpvB/TcaC N-terminal domain-containing protein [Pseudomonadota bacterium]